MEIRFLIKDLHVVEVHGSEDVQITDIQIDSRNVTNGSLFVCITGTQTDGHFYIGQALENGARAIMVQRDVSHDYPDVTVLKVPDTNRALANLSAVIFDYPSDNMKLIGVTGTNGKTTTTHLIESIVLGEGLKTGLMGTICVRMPGHTEESVNTTPNALVVNETLATMLHKGVKHAVLEVSSHALSMGRLWGCNFKTAVFTNLSPDHLDYHSSMEAYFEDKALLFSQLGNGQATFHKAAVINRDDPYAEKLIQKTSAQIVTYGIHEPADVRATLVSETNQGTRFNVETFKGSASITLPLFGEYNVYNALAAIGASLLEGVSLKGIKKSLESFPGVPGRSQYILAGQPFSVVIDYAHNPDGLEKVMRAVRAHHDGRILSVLGCRGDRDVSKRPIMGSMLSKWGDSIFLTSDNPNSEEPEAIIRDIKRGMDPTEAFDCMEIIDRRAAIRRALQEAKEGDCVLITGKGHETHQVMKGKRTPFHDETVVRELLDELGLAKQENRKIRL
ncbi:UDP-N-acetylmuramoyl-L-alanyl-D-glutamate--2,6-diaminopimelate ligase [Shouchella shacheensis]|uniref:UDP-N-acetylmuramoyl-L-alanyl-D-glutamate--2, 6-diaminopimelate ligase n=1 Tax=Shouchella shacheensis TaxID=1649580 RepID=UPI0007400B38|nr:UDP-N-acetylmuramoyl-L-alanyl-D-glutamate--2,6-diaminopimelate ligase [Shouchella shacheensis]